MPDCDLLNGRPQRPTTTGSIDTCGAWQDPNFGRARPGTTLDDIDSRRLGRAAIRLAVRRVRPAGTDAESVGRSRLLPPVVADLHDRRYHRQHQRRACRLHAIQRVAPSDPRLPNGGGYAVPNIYNINAGAQSLVGARERPGGGQRLRRVRAILGRLRHHRTGAPAQRPDPAGWHEHRTSGVRPVRAA